MGNIIITEKQIDVITNKVLTEKETINRVFRVIGSDIEHIEMEIFNRWGEELYKDEGNDPSWDGIYKDELCEESIYFYRVMIKGKYEDHAKQVIGYIRLIR